MEVHVGIETYGPPTKARLDVLCRPAPARALLLPLASVSRCATRTVTSTVLVAGSHAPR